jgi:hypothetical protein
MRLTSLTVVLDKLRTLTNPKDSLISDATDEITSFSIKNEHSIATEYVAKRKELVSDRSCNTRPDVNKTNKTHNA